MRKRPCSEYWPVRLRLSSPRLVPVTRQRVGSMSLPYPPPRRSMLPMAKPPFFSSPLYSPNLKEPSLTYPAPISTTLFGTVRSSTASSAAYAAGTNAIPARAAFTDASRHLVANPCFLAFMAFPVFFISALVLRAGRMVRAVDHHVAVEACTGVGLGARALVGERLQVVERRGVAVGQVRPAVHGLRVVAAMAFLAQPRHARLEQRRVHRAVRRVAVGAVVEDRAVFPEERAALLGVARVAH